MTPAPDCAFGSCAVAGLEITFHGVRTSALRRAGGGERERGRPADEMSDRSRSSPIAVPRPSVRSIALLAHARGRSCLILGEGRRAPRAPDLTDEPLARRSTLRYSSRPERVEPPECSSRWSRRTSVVPTLFLRHASPSLPEDRDLARAARRMTNSNTAPSFAIVPPFRSRW